MPINIDLSKTQMYLDWLKTKLFLDAKASSASRRIVKRGEVYRCHFGAGIGSEQCKERPCVILQYDAGNASSPNTIVAPITHTSSTLPVVVPIANKLDSSGNIILDGNVLLGNIVCVSKSRLGDFVTTLSPNEMNDVDKAIAISLDVKRHYDTLNNMYNDKLNYIEKLKQKITKLQSDVTEKDNELNRFIVLKDEFGIADLETFRTQIRIFFEGNMDKKQ